MKHFKPYNGGMNLEFVKRFCLEHGKTRTFKQGEVIEKAGEAACWIAYVEHGYFKYIVHNEKEKKDYCTRFAFENEIVADYPNCLDGSISEVIIKAGTESKVYIIEGCDLQHLYDENKEMVRLHIEILKKLSMMMYNRTIDLYRYTALERYEQLLCQYPQMIQLIPQKDIASFLKITHNYLRKLQKKHLVKSTVKTQNI